MLLNETVPQWVIDITVDVSNLNIIEKYIYNLRFHKLRDMECFHHRVNIFYIHIKDCWETPSSAQHFAMHSGRCRPGDLMDFLV